MADILTGYGSTVGNAKKLYTGGCSGTALLDQSNLRFRWSLPENSINSKPFLIAPIGLIRSWQMHGPIKLDKVRLG